MKRKDSKTPSGKHETKTIKQDNENIADLRTKTVAELRKLAKEYGITNYSTLRKEDLVSSIAGIVSNGSINDETAKNTEITIKNDEAPNVRNDRHITRTSAYDQQANQITTRYGGGTLEINEAGFGFLRSTGLLQSNSDIYVSANQIKRFALRNGDVVMGAIRPPRSAEHYEALMRVETVNAAQPETSRRRPIFESLIPVFPNVRLELETSSSILSTRLVDLFVPIGKGQRALIVSPPKAGKTTLLKQLANAITENHPEVQLMVLLIDERPEEVTDMARSVKGEIIGSTFDRPYNEHVQIATLALEKAKRQVEVGRDVVLLLDSITRLARASNLNVTPSGRTLSGGMDPAGLNFPKKFFGAARNIENGGSLTIIGTALVETGSRMDDVIYEEFKGTGNMEIQLSRKIAEQRIFPAIDITRSGTRKEDLLLTEEDLQRIWTLRRKIANMDETEVLPLIIDRLKKTYNNREFLSTIKS